MAIQGEQQKYDKAQWSVNREKLLKFQLPYGGNKQDTCKTGKDLTVRGVIGASKMQN